MNKKKVELNPVLQDDILRYKKNKLAANLALLALVFNCLYFMLFYSVHRTEFYKLLLGVSVITNLVVLLFGFFCSEGIKGYNYKFSFALFALAAIQIIRIFIYPLQGMRDKTLVGNYYFGVKMTPPVQGTILIVFLVASAACFIASGVYGLIMGLRLKKFQKKLDNGEISIEETLKQVEEAEAQKAVVENETVHADATEDVIDGGDVQETEKATVGTEEEDNG